MDHKRYKTLDSAEIVPFIMGKRPEKFFVKTDPTLDRSGVRSRWDQSGSTHSDLNSQ